VNSFGGGCDPLLEFRAVIGENPNDKKGGNVTKPAKNSISTTHLEGTLHTKWDQTVELMGLANKQGHYVQVILWDFNISGNTPIGYYAFPVTEVIAGLDVEFGKEGPRAKNPRVLNDLICLLKKTILKTQINLSFAMTELHRYQVKVIKAEKLPKVDTNGTIDAFIEVRVLRKDPNKMKDAAAGDSADIAWQGKTKVVPTDQSPEFNKKFTDIEVAGFHTWYLQFVLHDDRAPYPSLPVAHAIVPLKDISGSGAPPMSLGGIVTKKELRFEAIPGHSFPEDAKKANVSIELSYDIAFEEDE